MEKAAKGLETLTKGVSNIKKTPPRFNEKEQKTMNTKGLCFSYHELGHQSFQCPKKPCQAATLGLIALKEGGKIKNHGVKDKGPIQVSIVILE
jgi:hypothetical protein